MGWCWPQSCHGLSGDFTCNHPNHPLLYAAGITIVAVLIFLSIAVSRRLLSQSVTSAFFPSLSPEGVGEEK